MYDGVDISTASSIQRLTASKRTPNLKRKPSVSSSSSKKKKQTLITSFLTPRPCSNLLSHPASTVSKPTKPVDALYQNPLIQVSGAIDFPLSTLPYGLSVSGRVIGDGNCLPRAILLAKTGSQDAHESLRERAVDCIRANAQCFMADVQLMGDANIDGYCSRMSRNGEFGDAVFLMACCITENVSVQLFTWNCHQSPSTTSQSLSSQTFSPTTGSSQVIQIHLDTGDIRRGGIRTREPHYDTLAMALRTPLADITNLPATQILSTPTRRSRALFNSFSKDMQQLALDENSYDASHRIEFIQNVDRMDLDENSDPEHDDGDADVSNSSALVITVTQSDWDYPDVRFQGSKQDIMREHALATSWIDSHRNYCLPDGYSFTKQVLMSLKNIQTYAIEKGWKVPNFVKYNIWTCPLSPYAGKERLQYIQNHKNNPKNNAKVSPPQSCQSFPMTFTTDSSKFNPLCCSWWGHRGE